MSLPRILVVDDQFASDETERLVFLQGVGLTNGGHGAGKTSAWAEVVFCSGQREEGTRLVNDYAVVRQAVDKGNWSLVLLDVQFDSGDRDANGRPAGQTGDDLFGLTVQRHLEKEFHDLPVLMLTSKRQEEIGGTDTPYLSKHKLGASELKRALLRYGRMDVEVQRALLELDISVRADAPATFAAFRQAFMHAGVDASVLILGESGTGKEVLARYVHRMSRRSDGPFVAVNVAAIPKELVESELFGHEKGAFTGATTQRKGRFELASGGTLFLDEIGDMALDVQAKVLRVLQERKIVRVGGASEISVDIRLVCATSRDLVSRVSSGEFRGDLLYRINTVPITMPPMRERQTDIAPLARGFVEDYSSRQGKEGLSLSAEAQVLLEAQPFPGNVRELEHLVERLVSAAGHHQVIGQREVLDALGLRPASPLLENMPSTVIVPTPAPRAGSENGIPTLRDLADLIDRVPVDKDDPALKGIKPVLDATMERLYRRLAGAALERCRDPNDSSLNRQPAMRLLTGDANLEGTDSLRAVNKILGRNVSQPVTKEDLEGLVAAWRQGGRDA